MKQEQTTSRVWRNSDPNDKCPKCNRIVQHQFETKTIDGTTDLYTVAERCPAGCYSTTFDN